MPSARARRMSSGRTRSETRRTPFLGTPTSRSLAGGKSRITPACRLHPRAPTPSAGRGGGACLAACCPTSSATSRTATSCGYRPRRARPPSPTVLVVLLRCLPFRRLGAASTGDAPLASLPRQGRAGGRAAADALVRHRHQRAWQRTLRSPAIAASIPPPSEAEEGA